jgi:hypothetical protein
MIHHINNEFGSVCLTVEYDEKSQWVFYQWKGFIRMQDIKTGYNKIIEQVVENNAVAVLADHSQIVGPWNEANDWLTNDWTPRAIQAGIFYWAINTGNDLFSNISLEMFLNKYSQGQYKVQVFEQLADASKWLSNRIMLDPNPKKPAQLQTATKKELPNPAKQIEEQKSVRSVEKEATTKLIGKRL